MSNKMKLGQKGYFYRLSVTYFFTSNLVAQVPDFNLSQNLSNLLSNREALNQQSTFVYFFPSQNNGLVKKVLKFQNEKNKYNTVVQYKTTKRKTLCLSYKFVNKKYHGKIYSDCE